MFHYILYLLILVNSVVGFQRGLSPFTVSLVENPSVSNSLNLRSHPSNPWRGRRLQRLVQRLAGETSFSLGETVSSKAGTIQAVVKYNFVSLTQSLPILATSTRNVALEFLRKSWWILPMILALVPLYCVFVKGTCATMPDWWQVVKMDYIKKSQNASLVVGCFLFSNISYFLAGTYILNRFPFQKEGNIYQPTRFSMLGVWMLVAGLVSVIFHSVQALGSYTVAEALCYIDHGVAISSSFYYVDTCGLPSRLTLAIGLAGIVALVLTYPGYAWLHSSWHLLSAVAATRWAIEGHDRSLKTKE
jgi:hypothetical protein